MKTKKYEQIIKNGVIKMEKPYKTLYLNNQSKKGQLIALGREAWKSFLEYDKNRTIKTHNLFRSKFEQLINDKKYKTINYYSHEVIYVDIRFASVLHTDKKLAKEIMKEFYRQNIDFDKMYLSYTKGAEIDLKNDMGDEEVSLKA